MSAILEIRGFICDYCDERCEGISPAGRYAGWTMSVWNDDGEKSVVPLDPHFFDDDPIGITACPKKTCQEAIRLPDEVSEGGEEIVK